MKKLLLAFLLALPFLSVTAQPVLLPNGDFEMWTTGSYDEPVPWFTQNDYTSRDYGINTVTKVTGFGSSFAVRLETKASGTDTFGGIIVNTEEDITNGEGGVPFTFQPTNFSGTARYDIKTGDSAFILLVFKKNSNVISSDTLKFYGTQTTATLFNFSLNTLPQAPDSIIIAAASSNLFGGPAVFGSWIELDVLAFDDGSLQVQAPDGDFENWATTFYDDPDDWYNSDFGDVVKSTDKYMGTYALKLESKDDGSGFIDAGGIMLGDMSSPNLGMPFNRKIDTLTGYYKYATSGNDSGVISVVAIDGNGMPMSGYISHKLSAVNSYTYFEIPISSTNTPARLVVDIASSNYSGTPVDGSTLFIDDLMLKNSPTSIGNVKRSLSFTVYPNPAKEILSVKLHEGITEPIEVAIYDMAGRVLYNNSFAASDQINIPVSTFTPGIYQYNITSGDRNANGKFVKE